MEVTVLLFGNYEKDLPTELEENKFREAFYLYFENVSEDFVLLDISPGSIAIKIYGPRNIVNYIANLLYYHRYAEGT